MAKIPHSPESIFEEFTQDVQAVYNSDLTSIVLYGSGAKGEYVPKKSDINFLIVLSQKGIENLDKALELIPKWQKRKVAVPLFLSKEYIASALDTFPIEFLDMKNAYKLVYGEDVLKDIEIKNDDLRHQVERELRGKLLHLREGFLSTGNERDDLRAMLAASVSTFVSIFEGLLHLKGEKIPSTKAQIFEKTAELLGLQKNVLVQLINIKNGQWHGSKVQLQDIAKTFIGEIKKLVEIVDKME